jgi:hypothetical protein
MPWTRKPIDHGTNSGWSRHYADGDVDRWRAGEIPRCEPCIKAHARYNAEWRTNHPAPRVERAPRDKTATYTKRAASRVPNHVLGVLLASAPDEVAAWAERHLSPAVVERAWWHAENTDDLPTSADRSVA